MSQQEKIRWPHTLPRSVRRAFRTSKGVKNMKVHICRQLLDSIRTHSTAHQAWVASKGTTSDGTIRQRSSTETEAFVQIMATWKWLSAPWLQSQMLRGA